MTVQAMPLPRSGAIVPYLSGADFADAWCVEVAHPERSALQHFRHALTATPPWVRRLMRLRNRAVSLVGLKQPGHWQPSEGQVEVGSQLGIFGVVHLSESEVIAGDSDKHLRVVVSLQKWPTAAGRPASVSLTTAVHLHNTLGRLYMLPVWSAHKRIAPGVLRCVNTETVP
jgi:Protein of unknown function (DUF2867)